MPKSYQAALERFSHRKIAKSIKILPAKFEWSEGKMVFIPDKAIWKDDNTQTEQGEYTSSTINSIEVEAPTKKAKMTPRATLLFFFFAAKKRKNTDP